MGSRKRSRIRSAPEPRTAAPLSSPRLYWCDFTPASGVQSPHPDTHTRETTWFPFAHLDAVGCSAAAFARYRADHGRLLGSPAFWQAFRACQQAYLIDSFFDQHAYATLVATVYGTPLNDQPLGRQVVIFTEKKITLDHEEMAATAGAKEAADIHVFHFSEAGLSASKDVNVSVHDRFALLDEAIWHCGGTIGGMHPQIGALSGGWPDEQGRLRIFFERLVDQARKNTSAK